MERGEIGVGLVGYKFMGRTHSNAYRQVARFFNVNPAPRMTAICGRDEAGVREAAHFLGWEFYETNHRSLVTREDIGLIDLVTPGNTHREIVLAALEASKHMGPSSRALREGLSGPSRPRASPPDAVTRTRLRSTARRAAPPSTWSG